MAKGSINTEAGEGVEKGEGGFFYSLPTFLCNLIRNSLDAPFSLRNNVRAVFHHRGGGRGGKRGGGAFFIPFQHSYVT
jgi:hypothetical protein